MNSFKPTLLAIAFFSFVVSAFGQDEMPAGQVLDKIVAKVDNYILLESDVQQAFIEAISQSQSGITPPTRCQVFESLLINKLMVAKAEIDSVIVTDPEVQLQTENRFNMVMQQIGGDEEMVLQIYGKTAEQLKSEMFDAIKEQLIVTKMRETITQGVTVSPAEVRSFFETIPKDSLPLFSKEVTVGQLVKKPEVNQKTKQELYDQLLQMKEDILNGDAEFAELARKFSEDPGSAAQGGDLGFFGRGQLAPEYESTALNLKLGEISDPVETQFGFHMIQLLEIKGNTFNTRHILRIPKPTEEDLRSTERYLDSLRTEIMEDRLDFAKAAKEYSDDRGTSDNGGFFTDPGTSSNRLTLRTLEDPVLYFTIDSMQVGSITKPIQFEDPREGSKFRILYFKESFPAHRANLNDDYEKMKAATMRKKEDELLSNWFITAKEDVFIDIDPAYDRCNALQEK